LPYTFIVVLFSSSFIALFAGMIAIAEVYFALQILKLNGIGLSLLIGVYGGGMIVGNLISARKQKIGDSYKTYCWGMFLLSVGLGCVGLLQPPILPIVFYLIAGLGNGLIAVKGRVLVHDLVSAQNRGLAFGLKNAGESAGLVIALLTAGLLENSFGPRKIFIVSSVGVGLTLLAIMVVNTPVKFLVKNEA
jgi:MFS family permease